MKRLLSACASVAAAAIAATAAIAPATAADLTPAQVAGQTALSEVSDLNVTPDITTRTWYQKYGNDPRVLKLQATSPAMGGRVIPLSVIPAGEPGRPTIYLLSGAGATEQNADWLSMSQVVDFYADKKVNVVIPQAGAFSYYTDWAVDPNGSYLKGPQKWETFLTKELPGPLEARLEANNKRAIAGMSMSATSALLLAQHNPGFYDAVGSYAGCASTSAPIPYEFLRLTVNRGGAQPEQMWGPRGGDYNRYNDALINSEKLRGTELYISSATGLAGETDLPGYYLQRGVDPLVTSLGVGQLVIEGGAIEAAVNNCTHNLKAKLDSQGIPADYHFRNKGTHSWPGWREDLEASWPTYWRAFYGQ